MNNIHDHFAYNFICKRLHIPFDQYTLRPLRNIINDLTDIDYKINIPQNATMKFVNTKELYVVL